MAKYEAPGNRVARHEEILAEIFKDLGTSTLPTRIITNGTKVIEINVEGVSSAQLTAAVNKAKAKYPQAF